MEYCYSISKFKTFSFEQAKEIFPDNFKIKVDNDKNFLIVDTPIDSDAEVFVDIQRECDRIFFLTGEQLDPKFDRKKDSNGVTVCCHNIQCDVRIVKMCTENILKQQWDVALTMQLRLWQATHLQNLPLAAKINLLFQIIEIAFPDTRKGSPDYPEYTDASIPPAPKTEALLLRHLVSHNKGEEIVGDAQLKKYCNFLGINETFYNPTDAIATKAIKQRVNVLESEANKIIIGQIAHK